MSVGMCCVHVCICTSYLEKREWCVVNFPIPTELFIELGCNKEEVQGVAINEKLSKLRATGFTLALQYYAILLLGSWSGDMDNAFPRSISAMWNLLKTGVEKFHIADMASWGPLSLSPHFISLREASCMIQVVTWAHFWMYNAYHSIVKQSMHTGMPLALSFASFSTM